MRLIASVLLFNVLLCAQFMTLEAPVFAGQGLNDAVSEGHITSGTENHLYVATVCAAGTPDTVQYSRDGGSATACVPMAAGVNPMLYSAGNVSTAVWASGHLTIGTVTPHGLTTGSKISIQGASPAAFNLSKATVEVLDERRISVALPASPGRYSSGGLIVGTDGAGMVWKATTGHRAGDSWLVYSSAAGSISAQTFSQRGRDANLRSVEDKLRETISVADYGAKGDGVADDTQAFQRAIDFAGTMGVGAGQGARVVVPAPAVAYRIAGTIRFPAAGVVLEGTAAQGTQLNCTGNGDCIAIPHMQYGAGNSVRIAHLTINGTHGADRNGIHATDVVGLRLENVTVQNFDGPGSSCILAEDSKFWTERWTVTGTSTYNCTTHLRFLGDSANPQQPTVSFGYNRFLDLRMNVLDGQIGFSMENGAYVYNGTYRISANINADKQPTYLFAMSGKSSFILNEAYGTAEDNGAIHAMMFHVPEGNRWQYNSGQITGIAPGLAAGISAGIGFYDGLNRVETTHNLGAAGTAPGGTGVWLIPNFGADNGYCMGVGFNVYFDGYGLSPTKSYVVQGDGSHNGGSLLLTCPSSGNLSYYVFPSTGASNQAIPPSNLASYLSPFAKATGCKPETTTSPAFCTDAACTNPKTITYVSGISCQ